MRRTSSGRSGLGLSTMITLLFVAAAAAVGYLLLHDLSGPSIRVEPELAGRIGPVQEVTLTLEDPSLVRSVTVTVKRGGQSLVLRKEQYAELKPRQTLTFHLQEAKLPEGAFELEIKAHDGSWAGFGRGSSTTLTLPLRMDVTPPRIVVKTAPPAIRRGGAALIVYTISEESDHSGVKVGDYFFPGFQQPNGAYACLFPFPYTLTTANFTPEIMARDRAGNVTSSRLLAHPQNRVFKSDTMKISQSFLDFKAPELASLCPEKNTTLEQYICVNTGERVRNDSKLLELGRRTSPTFLWAGAFQRMPKSAVMANFGDFRTYLADGQKIDEQTHTGLDLASVAHAEVPATQAGHVLFADYMGIYGNMVLIDHGLGLMSLYSHMSELLTRAGEDVKAGQIIGKTGTTGLAGGDHLHFGILIGGIPVQPVEWLDSNWVKNNIVSRIMTPVS